MFQTCFRSALFATTALVAGPALAQTTSEQLSDPKAADVEVVGHILEPKQVKPTAGDLKGLDLPEGFEISVFGEDLTKPRMIAVAEDGTVYVTSRNAGQVTLLRDADGDGKAEDQKVVANRPNMHGIAIDGSTMYLVTVEDLYRAEIQADGTLGELERLVDDLPDAGQHANRTIAMGPDGKLYLSVGSTCNACNESDPQSATILRVEPDGSSRTIFASGLRNTIGFGFEPGTGALYGMDHGIDWLGDEEQAEELNRIEEGKKYGWPYIYADGKLNPQDYPENELTIEEWAAQSTEPELLYTPHAAPMQMAFYSGDQFPSEYSGDAFVAMRGSWNRKPPSGYEIVRIDFEGGRPVSIEPFVTGFLRQAGEQWEQLGRLAGLAVAGDGALLVSDDENGMIYRIAYTGGDTAANATGGEPQVAQAAAASTDAPESGAQDPAMLAMEVLKASGASLDVTSPAVADGQQIPDKFTAEGHNISPALDWAEGPEGTQSFAILMEDPDVREEPPFLHWSLYNLPAETTALPEGLPTYPKIPEPEGALQGANDRGSTGYYGPRPPEGDPAHHYHFQVFALDARLDLPHGAKRGEVLEAMEGHVLAAGEVVGTYQR